MLYRAIGQRPSVRDAYLEHLLENDGFTRGEADATTAACREELEQALVTAQADACTSDAEPSELWRPYTGGLEPHDDEHLPPVEAGKLSEWLVRASSAPKSFNLHPKLERILAGRREMAAGAKPLDWGAAEILALASLAATGGRVRFTGQDSARGTFSHRHAVFYDHEDGCPLVPLRGVKDGQAPVEIVNSPLCEGAALGFEYGYSRDSPDALVVWEAQFGDFVNAAQVILDQFITSGEDKWRRLSGLVLLLPHGFEGMGPEHSSARLERFLQLAAEDNIQIAQPSTPAQLFHLLRRQALRKWRKPLVVFTPKSLLRHPQCVSPLDECARGAFQRILPDPADAGRVKRVLLCTGRIFYDLAAYREKHSRADTAIIRVEQLYPLRAVELEKALQSYAADTPVVWVQDEPANMGAWEHVQARWSAVITRRFPLTLASRSESASPATGSANAHRLEQARLVARAFGDPEPPASSDDQPAPAKKAESTDA